MTKNVRINFENINCRCCNEEDSDDEITICNIAELQNGHYYIVGHRRYKDHFILTARRNKNGKKCKIIRFLSDEYITNYIIEHDINTYFNVVIKGGKVKSCGYLIE